MKSFALAASLVACASAQKTSFAEGQGVNGTSGQQVRYSAVDAIDVLKNENTANAAAKWRIEAYGAYYEDSGDEKIQIIHKLTADIKATDVVLFELAFRPNSLPPATDTATIGEDYVRCEMSRSSTDGAFWSASVTEGYYICKGTDVTDVCKGVATDPATLSDDSPESTSDWAAPYTDNDPADFWCEKHNTVKGAVLNPFECKSLRCVIERKLDTGDTAKDFKFTTPDEMVIKPGRARLYINKSTTQFAFAASNDMWDATTGMRIKVPNGASNLLLSALSTLALTLASLAF
jgi:hypothetical protein